MTSRFVLTAFILLAGAQPSLASRIETALHSFSEVAGAYPQAGLVADKAGNLYGTTALGGDNDNGVVFVLDASGRLSIIHRFQGAPSDGANPDSTLTIGRDGSLYGTTAAGGAHGHSQAGGGGIVFQLVPLGGGMWTENILHNFCERKNCADGDTPAGPVTLARDGTLYGTTELGGSGAITSNHGTVFRLMPPQNGDAWKETVLYDFCSQLNCADGSFPFAERLVLTKAGVLFGTTSSSNHNGTLFSLAKDGSGFQVLHDFGATAGDGKQPLSGVVRGPDGILYGMTNVGGTQDCGTAYSFDPSSAAYHMFYSFCAAADDAGFPEGEFTLLDGVDTFALWGVSPDGGTNDHGTIFKFKPPVNPHRNWTEKVMYKFCQQANCTDGARPEFGPLLLRNRALFGLTSHGGTDDTGVLFRFGQE